MRLASKKLAALTAPYDLQSVGHGCWPVETLSKGFSDQSARGCVMPALSSVDVLQEVAALSDRDAALENPRGTSMIQLSFEYGE
jgi:hypothetical protein